MSLQCLVCGEPVAKNTGIRCVNKCKHYVHYKCLECDEKTINDIKTGTIAILCACKECLFAKEVQADLDNESCEMKSKCGKCKTNTRVHDSDVCDRPLKINSKKLSLISTKYCAKLAVKEDRKNKNETENAKKNKENLYECMRHEYPTNGRKAAAEEKHAVNKNELQNKTEEKHPSNKIDKLKELLNILKDNSYEKYNKCFQGDQKLQELTHSSIKETVPIISSHIVNSRVKVEIPSKPLPVNKTEVEMKLKGKNGGKNAKKTRNGCGMNYAKSRESPMFQKRKKIDQSVIDILANVCHTVKNLRNQLRQLIYSTIKEEVSYC